MSGKTDNIKHTSKLQGVTVEDIAYSGREKNQIFMNQNPKLSDAERLAIRAADHKTAATGFETENNTRVEYNNNLKVLDPRFSNLEPLGSFILRYALVVDEKRSSLIIPSMSEIIRPDKTGQIKGKVKDPYRFKQEAVIVCVPSHEQDLKPGMRVQSLAPNPLGDTTTIRGYDIEYLHPDYNGNEGPKDPADKDFGYAIVPRSYIKVIIYDEVAGVTDAG